MPNKKGTPAFRWRFLVIAALLLVILAALVFFWRPSSLLVADRGSEEPTAVRDQAAEMLQETGEVQGTVFVQETEQAQQEEGSQATTDIVAGPTEQGLGTFPKWSTVEVTLKGPASDGMSADENPFGIPVEVSFTGPDGETTVVQAFYDGDGEGGLDGSVWKARFTPDTAGEWQYVSSSSHSQLDDQDGSFTVTSAEACESYQPGGLPDFSCQGRLEYVGERYLKLAEGAYWLKGGADEPEDFLAQGKVAGFSSQEEAVNFLADKGVNSIYLLLHNIDGDGNNVWPWAGSTPAEAKADTEHFDLARLAGWEEEFSHIQEQGLVLHFVLEDDSGWTGFNRSLYYREMVARFAHHNGLIWNISEEYNENYSPDQVREFARMIRELDPYDHPITVHHEGSPDNWEPFIGSPEFDLTSLQTDPSPQFDTAVSWLSKVESSGRTIPISLDESGQLLPDQRDLARQIVWSAYLGGANYEMFTQLNSGYAEFAGHFEDMRRARTVLESLPFPQLRPFSGLLGGAGYAFGNPGEIYVVYLPAGQAIAMLDLSGETEMLDAAWFNPRAGGSSVIGAVGGGAKKTFTAPSSQDWVLMLTGSCLRQPVQNLGFIGAPLIQTPEWVQAARLYFPLLVNC